MGMAKAEAVTNATEKGELLMGMRAKAEEGTKKRKAIKDPYAATKCYVDAKDNMLRMCTRSPGLVHAKVDWPIGPLAAGEKREKCPIAELPEELRAALGSRVFLSLVVNAAGLERAEVLWGEKRQSLFSFIDTGGAWVPEQVALVLRVAHSGRLGARYTTPPCALGLERVQDSRIGIRED